MILVVCANPAVDVFMWLENFKLGGVQRVVKEKRYPGGKGVHVAMALKELGHQVTLLGFWGGPTGEWIKSRCKQMGITCEGPETLDWTRTCLALKGEKSFDDTEILGSGPEVDQSTYQALFNSYQKLIPKAQVVALSGSLPKGLETSTYAELIKLAQQQNKKTFLDCTGEAFKLALKTKPFAVHLNQHEIAEISGEADFKKSLKWLMPKTNWSAVTAGAKGLFLGAEQKITHAQVKIEKVYSAIGSGDCLTAGLIHACVNESTVDDAAKWGVSCGAANCLREDLGMIHKKDVIDLMSKVEVSNEAV